MDDVKLFTEAERPSMANFNSRIVQMNGALLNKANAIGAYYAFATADGAPDISTDSALIVQLGQSKNAELWGALGHSYWAFIWQQFYVERSTSTLRTQLAVGGNGYMATRTYDNMAQAWTPWVSQVTATPPEEHDLPLAEGKVGADYNTFRKEQNGRVTLCVSIRRTDGSDLTGFEGAFTLPGGYRPYREEVRRIDLSGADGNPAGYAHLHIYPDGNAGIAGFGTGAKTAFCECGFWTA